MSRLLIAALFVAAFPAGAAASCAQAAARVGSEPGVRVVSVRENGDRCVIRVLEERPGQRPRSRVVQVRK